MLGADSAVAAAGFALRAAASTEAAALQVDLLVSDGPSRLDVARLWSRSQVIGRKYAAYARLRSRGK